MANPEKSEKSVTRKEFDELKLKVDELESELKQLKSKTDGISKSLPDRVIRELLAATIEGIQTGNSDELNKVRQTLIANLKSP